MGSVWLLVGLAVVLGVPVPDSPAPFFMDTTQEPPVLVNHDENVASWWEQRALDNIAEMEHAANLTPHPKMELQLEEDDDDGTQAKKRRYRRRVGVSGDFISPKSETLVQAMTRDPVLEHKSTKKSSKHGVHTSTNKRYGVPLSDTHPHLLSQSEVTPGINAQEFLTRRTRLLDSLPSGSVVVLPSAPMLFMSGDTEYEYIQHVDMLYLTGMSDPGVLAVIARSSSGEPTLLVWLKNQEESAFTSDSLDSLVSIADFGAKQSFSLSQDVAQLGQLLRQAPQVYFNPNINPELTAVIAPFNLNVMDPQVAIERMRLFKSPAEIRLLSESFSASAVAHNWAIKLTRANAHEAYIRAVVSFFVTKEYGHMAYPPIVASGPHAEVLHYSSDNDVLREGDMILMDVGGRRFNYCADITRTWPSNCVFTVPQETIYNLVLYVQTSVLEYSKRWPSESITLRDLDRFSKRLIEEELTKLGIPSKYVTPHAVSHAIGLDVHDCSEVHDMPLAQGYAFTIEPGVYLPDDDEEIPAQFRGISVRIEDDCFAIDGDVTCPSMLAARYPKDITDICGTAVTA